MESLRSSANVASPTKTHLVLENRKLNDSTFVLRLEKKDLDFTPGQYIHVGIDGDVHAREYSVYAPKNADFLEVLVKEVDGGLVSPKLAALKPGDHASVEGPFGYFTMDRDQRNGPLLFIATGTGISPFHCFVGSYPNLDYTLLHGIRTNDERYEHSAFDPERTISCVSREEGGDYRGRVTDYLRTMDLAPETLCYLCGNCDMIYEVYDILTTKGIAPSAIHAEVYF